MRTKWWRATEDGQRVARIVAPRLNIFAISHVVLNAELLQGIHSSDFGTRDQSVAALFCPWCFTLHADQCTSKLRKKVGVPPLVASLLATDSIRTK